MSTDIKIQDILNSEIEAKKSYDRIIKDEFNEQEILQLKLFREAHKRAINFWSNQCPDSTGAVNLADIEWKRAVKAFKGASRVFGNENALSLLEICEKYILDLYKRILRSRHVSGIQKLEIINNYMISQERKLDTIKTMRKIKSLA